MDGRYGRAPLSKGRPFVPRRAASFDYGAQSNTAQNDQKGLLAMSNEEPEIIDAEIVDSDNLPVLHEASTSYGTDEPIKGSGRDWETYAEPSRRCAAHKKTGERCKNAAILGSTVCRFHGGAAKHVKRAARARIENAADVMARQLLGLALTAEGEGVKLAAIKDALDRAGLKAPSEVILSQGETKPWEELFEGISTVSREESRAARGYAGVDSSEGNAGIQSPPATAADNGNSEFPSSYREYDSRPQAQEDSKAYRRDAPPRQPRPGPNDRERDAQPPVTGADALRIAAELTRQKAITSPHKRYPRP